MDRLRRDQEGFTLVELMVVLLVIGILVAIGLPVFLGAKIRADERRTQAELRTGLIAGLTYWADRGDFTGFAERESAPVVVATPLPTAARPPTALSRPSSGSGPDSRGSRRSRSWSRPAPTCC